MTGMEPSVTTMSGEGAYLETEHHIRNLLVDAGADVSDIVVGGVQP